LTNDAELILRTGPQNPQTDYTLTVSNVTTTLQPPNLTGLNGQITVRVAVPLLSLDEATEWKYDDRNVSQPFLWRTAIFNDAAWSGGLAPFGYTLNSLPLPIRTPLTPDTNRVTTYYRHRFDVPTALAASDLRLYTFVDDGVVFWLNGQHLFHLGMPESAANHGTLATRRIGDATLEGPFDLPNPSLVAGTNVLAVEVHQEDLLDPDVVFGAELELLVLPSLLPPPVAPLTISLQTNTVVLEWSEPSLTLESATNIMGPWTPLTGEPSPVYRPATNQMEFFQLR